MPPGGMPPGAYPPKKGNGMAVASLVCGILGCIPFITGLLAILFGVLGIKKSKQTGTGSAMAIVGLILGLISIGGWGLFGGGLWALIKGTEVNRNVAGQFIRDVGANNIDAALGNAEGINKEELTDLNKTMSKFGTVTDVTTLATVVENDHAKLTGLVKFSSGDHAFEMEQKKSGDNWKVTFIHVQ
jgi:hypothetical protein